jgi:hypothetical protein
MKNAFAAFTIGGVLALPAAAANLVPNPDFTNGIDGWTTTTTGTGAASLDTTTGSPAAPSIRLVANPATSDVSTSSSCVEVDDSENVDLMVNLNGTAGAATIGIDTYSDTACATALSTIVSDPVQANQTWTTYLLDDVTLPNGSKSAKVVLTATEGQTAEAGDVNFDHIEFGPAGSVPALVNVNQEGLSGAWYNPATSGQGMEFVFSPDSVMPGNGNVSGAWYTYDVTGGDATTQRWYTFNAALTGDAESVDVTIYQNTGGNFDAPPTTAAVAVGTGTLSFDSCTSGTFAYTFDDGRTGSIPLGRVMPSVDCVESGVPSTPSSDFGFTGAWYNPATSGQGLLTEINPVNAYAFVGWYTYATAGESSGASGQRWFTAQTPYTVGSRTIDFIVYASTGGTFDSSSGAVHTDVVGTAKLTFTSCTAGTFDYTFTAGELSGKSGTIPLTRISGTPASCPSISQ